MTKSIGLFEAKTHLSELLEDVQHGASIIITKRGVAVAKVMPFVEDVLKKRQDTALRLTKLRERLRELYGEDDDMSVREMLEQGRKW